MKKDQPQNQPVFRIQIVDRHGKVVVLPAGGTLERDMVELCASSIANVLERDLKDIIGAMVSSQSVGLFVPQKVVELRIRAAIREHLVDIEKATADGLTDAIMALKKQTIPLASQ